MEQRTVMMVDDQPDVLKPLIEFLEGSGFRIIVAQSGEAALNRLKKFPLPDVILMDVLMPEMDGFATCRSIKEIGIAKDIPVLYMTALSDTVELVKGFQAGGVDYLTKPVQHDEVFARLQTHLKIKHLQQELQEKNAVLETKNRQLEELNACKDKFFSILAHDLREPFNSLLVLTELIIDNIEGWEPQNIKSIAQKVRTSAGNLYELLENLLTWSRIQRNMMEVHPQRINLTHVVAQNISRLEVSAQKKTNSPL
ncbi:response regulator receiver sensor signal transduction histidine kinase [Candidatus Moduliflexus flocculans]|uniref:Response regulator receiver sensor signal transduction histidine kinase n=1 Tax=Candidatus Moduliflexus flocculans TaxID=1499966 RepID=A0A0S6VRJ0_9BACT|nr:response regulator receiver sensor signal transduction histidine kinase [Candidatus Moduliflexus flocculans]